MENPLTIFSEYKRDLRRAKPDIRNFRMRKIKRGMNENLRMFIKRKKSGGNGKVNPLKLEISTVTSQKLEKKRSSSVRNRLYKKTKLKLSLEKKLLRQKPHTTRNLSP